MNRLRHVQIDANLLAEQYRVVSQQYLTPNATPTKSKVSFADYAFNLQELVRLDSFNPNPHPNSDPPYPEP